MQNKKIDNHSHETSIERMAKQIYKDRDMIGSVIGVKFTYYPQSIKRLEEQINLMYPEGEREIAPHMAVVLGIYFGETIRQNLHKKGVTVTWKDPEGEDIFEAALEIKGVKSELGGEDSVFRVKPLLRAYKYINVDRTDSMWAMYAMLQDMCHGRIQSKPDKKWRDAPRGYTYRVFQTEKEQD